jgi:hypothetical protein
MASQCPSRSRRPSYALDSNVNTDTTSSPHVYYANQNSLFHIIALSERIPSELSLLPLASDGLRPELGLTLLNGRIPLVLMASSPVMVIDKRLPSRMLPLDRTCRVPRRNHRARCYSQTRVATPAPVPAPYPNVAGAYAPSSDDAAGSHGVDRRWRGCRRQLVRCV